MDNLFNMAVILSAIDRASGPVRKVATSLGDLSAKAGRMAEAGQRMTVAGALTQGAANQMTSALGKIVNPAIQFESAMADVKKVVAFETPEGFEQMSADILKLSTDIPMAADGIAAIVASAGQSGIAQNELMGFAEAAAKMGVAFDLSGAEAGQMMANWRAALGLGQEETVALADAANFLSNNMNATAGAIGEVIERQGAVAKAAGLAETQTAALAAALLSSGTGPEIAATALKNLTGSLTMGAAASKRQQDALAALGFSAQEMAAMMQDDAQGAITAVFEALAAQPAEERGSLATMLFGEESKGAIMPLLTNLGNLHNAFGLIGDATNFAGSMQAEYEERAATTGFQIQRMSNILTRLGVTLGNLVLPALNDGLLVLQRFGNAVTEFAAAHPLLGKIAIGFFGVLAVALAIVAPILSVVGGLIMMGSFGLMGVAKLATGLGLLHGRLLTVLPVLRSFIFSALRFVAGGAWSFATAVGRMAVSLVASLVPALGAAVTGTGAFAMGVGRMAVSLVASLVPALGAAIVGAAAFAAALLANPITWIVLAITTAAALIYAFWGPIKGFFTDLWGSIEGAFKTSFVDGVLKILEFFSPMALVAKGFDALAQYLFGIDLSVAGAKIVDSIWQGMKSVASKPVAAIAEIVGKVRDFLPFSPAKVGPLKDLDRIRLIETVAESVKPAPLVKALRGATAAAAATLTAASAGTPAMAVPIPMAMATPRLAELPAPGVAAGGAGGAAVSFTINIQGDASPETVSRLEKWVRENGRLIAEQVERERTRSARRSFGG